MIDALHLDYLTQLADAPEDTPCKATWANAACYALGMDDEAARVNRSKLTGRPAGKVRAFLETAKGEPELLQFRITQFAKYTPATEGDQ